MNYTKFTPNGFDLVIFLKPWTALAKNPGLDSVGNKGVLSG